MNNDNDNRSQVLVELIEEGPLKITGNFVFMDIKRLKESSPGEVLLCRCGKSLTKPYCDGSHKSG
jgi:CDGSH-type Zn-finger protein